MAVWLFDGAVAQDRSHLAPDRGFICRWLTFFPGVCAYVCLQEKVTIRAKKLVKNNLLRRRQFIIDVIHPGKANVSKADLKVRLVVLWLPGCERMSVKNLRGLVFAKSTHG